MNKPFSRRIMNSSNLSVFHQSPKVSKKPNKSNVKTNKTIFVTPRWPSQLVVPCDLFADAARKSSGDALTFVTDHTVGDSH